MFYCMSQNEDPDIAIKELFQEHGFLVTDEDVGARGTVFDDFDSLKHFQRVEDFKNIFEKFDGLNADQSSDLILNLEEVHPKLFDAFAAAARTLSRAETEEDYAQAALSGRRLLERTADYLFPARETLWNNRKVGRAEYKNRLWAYIDEAVMQSKKDLHVIGILGKEADRLVDLFNAGLHSDSNQFKVEGAFVSLVIWLSEVITLSPSAARKPYLAYEDSFNELFTDTILNNK